MTENAVNYAILRAIRGTVVLRIGCGSRAVAVRGELRTGECAEFIFEAKNLIVVIYPDMFLDFTVKAGLPPTIDLAVGDKEE